MIKTALSIGFLGTILALTSCAPTAYVIGTSNPPINYTYAPGYNPPQVAYPDVPTDANTNIDNAATIQQEKAINEMHDSIAAHQAEQELYEAAEQQAILLQFNSMSYQQ